MKRRSNIVLFVAIAIGVIGLGIIGYLAATGQLTFKADVTGPQTQASDVATFSFGDMYGKTVDANGNTVFKTDFLFTTTMNTTAGKQNRISYAKAFFAYNPSEVNVDAKWWNNMVLPNLTRFSTNLMELDPDTGNLLYPETNVPVNNVYLKVGSSAGASGATLTAMGTLTLTAKTGVTSVTITLNDAISFFDTSDLKDANNNIVPGLSGEIMNAASKTFDLSGGAVATNTFTATPTITTFPPDQDTFTPTETGTETETVTPTFPPVDCTGSLEGDIAHYDIIDGNPGSYLPGAGPDIGFSDKYSDDDTQMQGIGRCNVNNADLNYLWTVLWLTNLGN